jgi:hypothetical protein
MLSLVLVAVRATRREEGLTMNSADERKLALSEAVARVAEQDFEDLLYGVTEDMPHCWAKAFSGAAILSAVAYVSHLERLVRSGAALTDRHHRDCDGRCHITPCLSCTREGH